MKKPDKRYFELVQRLPLLRIRDEAYFEQASQLVDELADKVAAGTVSEGESEYFVVLTHLVADYESRRYFSDGPRMTPRELLAYLMEINGLKQSDLSEIFGGQSRVSDFLKGRRPLSKTQIERLSRRFRLSPAAFFDSEPSRGRPIKEFDQRANSGKSKPTTKGNRSKHASA